jgi:hypothetical protein
MTLPVPTEDAEQRVFVQWLEHVGLPFFRVPNETYTKSWSQKAKNKALGVKPGVPDLFVFVPGKYVIAIEMKRTKGSATSQAQKDWIAVLNTIPGCQAFIAKGADEAIAVIRQYVPAEKQTSSIF